MIDKLVRPQIKQIEEVNWGDIPVRDGVRLLWGENPIQIKESVQTIKDEAEKVNFYPNPTKYTLRKKLADYNNVLPEDIIPTNGSDEALELIAKVFISEGDEAIMPMPSYSCFESVSQMMGAEVQKIPLEKDFSLDLKKLLIATTPKTKIVWLANPNNPTGNILVSEEKLETLAEKLNCLLVIDECYFELSGVTAVPLIKKYPNILVSRSFSKVFALAGVRLGYIIANQKVTSYLNRLQQTNQVFSVNRFAQAAGVAIIGNKRLIKQSVSAFKKLKQNFEKQLGTIKEVDVVPTKTTFCLLKIKNALSSSTELKKNLQKDAIYIKDCSIYKGLGKEYVYLGVPVEKYQEEVAKKIKTSLDANKPLIKTDGIIFDLDGTLIDTTLSYRKAIKKTSQFILQQNYNTDYKVSDDDISEIKNIPGFNNEWDTTASLLKLITSETPKNSWKTTIEKWGLVNRNSKLFKYVFEAFQTYYLGRGLYYKLYKKKAPIEVQNGLIDRESLLVKRQTLKKLQDAGFKIGIATGRPRFEAMYVLRKFALIPQFFSESAVVALEDVQKEKPDPDALLKAQKILNVRKPVYIGDTVNDVLAAQNARMPSIFLGQEKLGDYQITDVNQIIDLIL